MKKKSKEMNTQKKSMPLTEVKAMKTTKKAMLLAKVKSKVMKKKKRAMPERDESIE